MIIGCFTDFYLFNFPIRQFTSLYGETYIHLPRIEFLLFHVKTFPTFYYIVSAARVINIEHKQKENCYQNGRRTKKHTL